MSSIIHGTRSGDRDRRACDRRYHAKSEDVEVTQDPRAITCKNKACQDVARAYESALRTAARIAGSATTPYTRSRNAPTVHYTIPVTGQARLELPLGGSPLGFDLVAEFTTRAEANQLRDLFEAGKAAAAAIWLTYQARELLAGDALAQERIEELRSAEARS